MFARRRSLVDLTAMLMTAFVMAMLFGAPLSASTFIGFSDPSRVDVLRDDHAGRHGEPVGTHTHAKPCTKLKSPPPTERQCRHAVGGAVALRRSRADAGGVALVASDTALIGPFSGYGMRRPRIVAVRLRPPRNSLRAPFWAVFARAARLRN